MTSPSTDSRSRLFLSTAIAVTALVWLVHVLGYLAPGARLWGVNHLLFLPPVALGIYLGAGLIALAGFLPSLRPFYTAAFNALAEALFARSSHLRRLALAALALVLFWLLHPAHFFLGDSYSVTANIGNDLPVIYKWTEQGAVFLAYAVSRLLPADGDAGRTAYLIVSILSGGITVYFFAAIAERLGETAAHRLFLFSVMLFGGWLLLFFGYTENYPPLWPCLTGYMYFSLRYLSRQGSLVWPTLCLIAALLLHVQTVFFAGSYVMLLFARSLPARIYHKRPALVWTGLAAVCIAAGGGAVYLYRTIPEFSLSLVPLVASRPPVFGYWLFSPTHLIDVINQLLLVVPLLPLLVLFGWKGKAMFRSRTDWFLALLSIGGLVFLLIIDPKLGMGRDWDLFALAGLGPAVMLARQMTDGRHFNFPVYALIGLIAVAPFFATHLHTPSAVTATNYLLHRDMPRSRTGMILMRDYLRAQDRAAAADSLERTLVRRFPAYTLVPRAYTLVEQGRLGEAMAIADSLEKIDPHSVEVMNLIGNVSLKAGRYAAAIHYFEKAARLGYYESRILVPLAIAYSHLGRHGQSIDVLRRAQKRDPHSPEVNESFMTSFYGLGEYDSSLAYARRCLEIDPGLTNAYMMAGFSAHRLGQGRAARTYLETFKSLAPGSPYLNRVDEVLLSIR